MLGLTVKKSFHSAWLAQHAGLSVLCLFWMKLSALLYTNFQYEETECISICRAVHKGYMYTMG